MTSSTLDRTDLPDFDDIGFSFNSYSESMPGATVRAFSYTTPECFTASYAFPHNLIPFLVFSGSIYYQLEKDNE
jgi:hypothetical protein